MWLFNLFFKQRTPTELLLLSSQVHGSHYYDCLTLLNQSALHVGQPLVLKREPTNEYDAYAIEVYTKTNSKLGYIPKHQNQVIATLMDQGCRVDASIDKILTTAWEPVTIKVYCRDIVK